MESLVGRRLGDYELVELLSEDATGGLYKAFQFSLERPVSIRVLEPNLAADPAFLERYRKSVLAAAALNHPGILRLYDLRAEEGLYFTVMDFAEGGSLRQRLRSGPLPLQESLGLAARVAEALDYAHERGVVHGGLAPERIVFDAAGNPLVTDFGLTWLAAQAGRQDLQPEYAAPEQAQGLGVGPQTDLYALGLVLFEALTGRPPFRGDTPLSTLYQQVNEASPALASLGVRSAAAQDTLDRALAKSPDQRYPSGATMAHALREAEAGAVLPVPPHEPAPVRPAVSLPDPHRRRRSAWPALLALGLVILVSVAALAGLATGRIQGREVADFASRLLQREVPSPAPIITTADLEPSATAATLAPTATSVPTATPAPTASPSPSPTLGTTETVIAASASRTITAAGGGFGGTVRSTNTPTATARAPSATPTTAPTATETPLPPTSTTTRTPTPAPSPTPTVTPTAVETLTPEPTATPAALDMPTPEPTAPPPPPPAQSLSSRIAYPAMDPQTGSVATWIASTDGSGAYQLAPCMRQPDFRGDGRLVMNGEGCGTDSLWVMNADGSERWEASRHPEDSHPSWSPDGGSVAYSSSQQGDGQWRIYTHAIGGEIPHAPPFLPLGTTGILGTAPVWLSNGEITYNGCDYVFGTGGNCGLWVVSSQGGEPRRLTTNSSDIAGDELGGAVLFMSTAAGAWDVYSIRIDGSGATRLTTGPGNSGLPTWSPDGSAIAFLSDRDGQWAVWTMRPDGSEPRKLFDLNATPGPRWTEERITWGP